MAKTNNKISLLLDASRQFDRGLLLGISKYSRIESRWQLDVNAPVSKKSKQLSKTITQIKKNRCKGIIAYAQNKEIAQSIIASNLPCVIICAEYAVNNTISITGDHRQIGKMGAEYLLSLGFKNLAFCGFKNTFWSTERLEHFKHIIADAGLEVFCYNKHPLRRDFSTPANLSSLSDWLSCLPKPVGLMACNDTCAYDVIESCKAANINVPDEVSVLGVDNDELVCNFCAPPISSIAFNTAKAGYEAAEMLDQLIQKKKNKKQSVRVHPLYVVTRQSTKISAIEDVEIYKALDYIRGNCDKLIQVSDVVNATSVSRRSLERLFKEKLKKSIYDKIKSFKIRHIKELLIETDMPISEIALKCGFSGDEHFSRYFKRQARINPNDYRKKYQEKDTGQ